MAKSMRGRRRIASRQSRPIPYPLPSHNGVHSKKCSKTDKKDWVDATCSVCMEYPHNAVLLLCSSHEKGCRPYMCGTSLRYSNCLDQYKKAYTKATSLSHDHPLDSSVDNPFPGSISSWATEKCELAELSCPLCRGQVKGWTVVEPAREYLNAKKRSCTQDNCSFVGTYKDLRKHVRAEHPSARPREVDPVLEQNWRRLEREREHDDVISTIRSSMPGAMIFGDYVIEGSHYGFDTDDEEGFDLGSEQRGGDYAGGIDRDLVNVFLLLHALGPGRHGRDSIGIVGSHQDIDSDSDSEDDDGGGGGGGVGDGISLVGRLRRQGRVLLGRSGRRSRRSRVANEGRR